MTAKENIEVVDLYAPRARIHPRMVKGRFQKLRVGLRFLWFAIFFGLPWVPWGDRPAVWLDLDERKYYFFDAVIWPQDFALAFAALILGAYALFAVTNFVGRAFCGYACPQSVWFGSFIWLEALIEGNDRQRQRLDARPWDGYKISRRAAKWALWAAFAFATSFTINAYLYTAPGLLADLAAFELGGWQVFWLAFFFVTTFGMGAVLREQVCFYMCPYARFQSVMFDPDTLVVSYDANRGEPRGPRRRDADRGARGLGDCVDCLQCVKVCPVGIDIRDGLQYECISCALCIDACDQIMDRMGYPRGLVRYTTENELEGRRTHLLRPRLVGYAVALVLALGGFTWAFLSRPPIEVDVLRDRSQLFRTVSTAQGTRVENAYEIRVYNKTESAHGFVLDVTAPLKVEWFGPRRIQLPPGGTSETQVRLRAPADAGSDPASPFAEITFEVTRDDGRRASEVSRFVSAGR